MRAIYLLFFCFSKSCGLSMSALNLSRCFRNCIHNPEQLQMRGKKSFLNIYEVCLSFIGERILISIPTCVRVYKKEIRENING